MNEQRLKSCIDSARSLISARNCLGLLQTALILTSEGTTRATAKELSDRLFDGLSITLTPATVGQVFGAFDIPSKTTHGKARFVLAATGLEEMIHKLTDYCNEEADKLQQLTAEFRRIDRRTNELVEDLKTAIKDSR
ncbi:hypothetical protein [Dehalogenimonas alkenigignens]|uniref:hypothetical protein n=1 Tax=Dehalogenimonas alkenigignens TaxID=1217799 RepID=UPI000D572970|nr:hypothetical protein [Dehalogenimonas alkenigignens]PVV82556.1 hypothetical protein DD509_08440 [Dehalogenimonas alkenigignens]